MKASCIILSVTIFLAIIAVCVMVKFATDITVDERKREFAALGGGVYHFGKAMGVITLHDNTSMVIADRFPYVAAVTRNSTSLWSFACFASVILLKWVVTSAHCRRPGATHRVLLFQDFARNFTHTYPVLFWRLHEKFNSSDLPFSPQMPRYDIAVAKLNVDSFPFSIKPSLFNEKIVVEAVESAVWKTVSTMGHTLYLTNDFDRYDVRIVSFRTCYDIYGTAMDDSLICIDMSKYNDCFIHEFGPLYYSDKVVGILAVQPKDCETKIAIFTNISYYSNWILKSTHTTYYGYFFVLFNLYILFLAFFHL